MTRPEVTGKRNLDFSRWIRKALPDSSTGFKVSDLDFILMNEKTKKVMLIEAKIYGGPRSKMAWQRRMFKHLDNWISVGIASDWEYLGFHWVTFGNTAPNNGTILFNDEKVSEEKLIELLSF